MSSMGTSPDLTWIVSLDGKRPGSPGTRRVIRRQAMSKAAAARRRVRSYNKERVHQLAICPQPPAHEKTAIEPGYIQSDCGSSDPNEAMVKTSTVSKRKSGFVQAKAMTMTRVPLWIPASPPSTGYEAMRIRYDFDVLDLSALTALHISRAIAQPLQDDPSQLIQILRRREWSYFSYMPWRYGFTQCLDDAICCVAARVRQWITSPGKPTDQVLVLYSRAVRSLQAALNDPSQRMQADVLCATEVLWIFELLDSDRDDAWMTHAAGAATLIQLRGPRGYETDFEKALFLGQVGPILSVAALTGTPCFLEEPAWQGLFRSIALRKPVFSKYSDASVEARACISLVPGLFCSIRSVLRNPIDDPEEAQELLNRIVELRARLTALKVQHNLTAVNVSHRKYDLQYDLVSLYAANSAMLERFIVALDSKTAIAAEARAQHLSEQIVHLERAAVMTDPQANLYLSFKMLIAKATIDTKEEWREEILCRPPDALMDKDVFDHWVSNIRPPR
ncbi:MAG: hypothetical protein Q9213_001950 [Squamulea squamosa]